MSISNIIRENKNEILKIAAKYGVKKIRLFGSVARGEEKENSDIDFLVVFEEGRTLFDLIAIRNELEGLLNRSVDVVTEESIHYAIRENIKKEVVEI